MSFSPLDVAVLFAALVSAIVTIVGWWQTYIHQKKLFEAQVKAQVAEEQRVYDRTRAENDLAVLEKVSTLCDDILGRIHFLERGTTPSPEEQSAFREKVVEFRSNQSKAKHIVQSHNDQGDTIQNYKDLMTSFCTRVGEIVCRAAIGSDQYEQIRETVNSLESSVATRMMSEAQQNLLEQLETWRDENSVLT